MIPSPYLLFGALLAVLVAALGGYAFGVNVEGNRREAETKDALVAMVARHNELAQEDAHAVRKAEETRQADRLAAAQKRHALELEAAHNHQPDCDWSPDAVGLLNDLVDTANGAPTARRVPDGLRPDAPPPGLFRPGGEGVGSLGGGHFWRMSVEAR